ncbi:hypothetical protein ANO14919_067610 [Xylariales sp. No.14919]|nr:hypothetical protein ANO14919_067610 [Xylariales sp. No.14919]
MGEQVAEALLRLERRGEQNDVFLHLDWVNSARREVDDTSADSALAYTLSEVVADNRPLKPKGSSW